MNATSIENAKHCGYVDRVYIRHTTRRTIPEPRAGWECPAAT
jgi:hypothetical protein